MDFLGSSAGEYVICMELYGFLDFWTKKLGNLRS